ncbi:MAG TPA: alpha/beta fold hydrolase [Myxococcales bacterium]|nr:alpha/beta fold hydrolase [Myxococcales bacterium]
MSSFILVPGAGGTAWYWHRVVPLLEQAGHEAIAVDLPGDDESASLDDYAAIVVRAIGGRKNPILVAQSLGGFTAPLVCARVPVRMLVFVNAMIPLPGETAGEWGDNTGSGEARVAAAKRHGYSAEFDLATYFLHDVPQSVIEDGAAHQRSQADSIFSRPCRFERWPDVPIRVVIGTEDRLFPPAFQRRVARQRLKRVVVDKVAGGHVVALSNPRGLADRLLAYERDLD